MIQSFACKQTRLLFEGGDPPKFRAFKDIAIRKLTQLDAAQTIDFLSSPPGNQLEALKGDRKGQYSIRINRQFRLCFGWTEWGPVDVEIIDYH
jgi:proteic killer suppression protein